MEKLNTAEERELVWWYGTPAPEWIAGSLQGQSYEPKGSGYDPATDLTLETMVIGAHRRPPTEWERIQRILDRVASASPQGSHHLSVLQAAYGSPPIRSLVATFDYPNVVMMCPCVRTRGRILAENRAIERNHQAIVDAAVASGASPITVAMRVLDAPCIAGQPIAIDVVMGCALESVVRAVRETDRAFLDEIANEVEMLLHCAGTAYRAAKKELGLQKKQAKQARQKAKDEEWAAYLEGKKEREATRFDAKLRRAS